MMKLPLYVTKIQISKICRWILILGAMKLALFGSLIFLPTDGNESSPQTMVSDGLHLLTTPVRGQIAHAAQTTPATPNVPPVPAPRINPGQPSPFSQQPTANAPSTTRPDAATPTPAPVPQVNTFVPRDSVQRKQEELNRREQELLALQQQMQTRLDELKNLETKIQDMLKQANNVQDDKLKHLIDVYSNMKAKQAAEVLATLDSRIAVRILAGMRGKQAGEILTYMQAEPAAKLSELLSKTQI